MLGAEIRELRWRLDDRLDEYGAPQGVTKESVDAIDHVRTIGNIGAHMERDANGYRQKGPGYGLEYFHSSTDQPVLHVNEIVSAQGQAAGTRMRTGVHCS